MSEAKRVNLTTISHTVSTAPPPPLPTTGSSRFGVDLLPPSDKSTNNKKLANKSIRLDIELFQTDSSKYPEFNYAKLVRLEKKKLKKLKQKSNGFSDPFDDNEEDMVRIAKELERKYGSAYGRSKEKNNDYDRGMGYDESDSFIDNTEAYDEIIPDEVEAIEGGFYINCGALEFKKLHNESLTTKTDEIIKMPERFNKRVISSSSEQSSSSGEEAEDDGDSDDDDDDDDDDDEEDEEEEDDDDEEEEESSVQFNSKSTAEPPDKKKPNVTTAATTTTITTTTTTAATLINKKKQSTSENSSSTTTTTSTSSSSSSKKTVKDKLIQSGSTSGSTSSSPKPANDDGVSDTEKERTMKKSEKTTTVKDMLKTQRDNFLKTQYLPESKASSNDDNKSKTSEEDDEDNDEDEQSSSEEAENEITNATTSQPNSPQQQQKLKKPTTTNEDITPMEKLRTMDTKLPELDPKILTCITQFVDYLTVNNLVGKKFQFDEKLTSDFLRIDDALVHVDKINRGMVLAHLEYKLSLPKYFLLRKVKSLRMKEERLKTKRAFYKLQKAVTEIMPGVLTSYDAELRKYAELQALNMNSDQPPKMPKKKFPWNTNLRNLLYDIYEMHASSYPILRTRKETLEEFSQTYLRQKVVQIWPSGWMHYDELQREVDKRKINAKKLLEKNKVNSATALPLPAVVASNNTTLNLPALSVQTLAVTSIPANTTTSQVNSNTAAVKQFDDTAARSNANSDNESVASSSTSSGLKRKSSDKSNKLHKQKIAKLNGGEPPKHNVNKPSVVQASSAKENVPSSKPASASALVTTMPSTSINNTTSTTTSTTTTTFNTNQLVPFAQQQQQQQQQVKQHSNGAEIIDLDNYSALQKDKPIVAIASYLNSYPTFANKTSWNKPQRRESSGDSEIEIVGVFPVKNASKTKWKNNRSNTANNAHQAGSDSMKIVTTANSMTITTPAATTSANSNSNNNNNNKAIKYSKSHSVDVMQTIPSNPSAKNPSQ